MKSVKDRKVLVTGAANGIGAAIARLFVKEGARVTLTDVADAPGEALARELGGSSRYVHLDVSSEDDWQKLVGQMKASGGLDILILNAGIMTRPLAAPMMDDPLPWMTTKGLDRNLAINVRGVVYGVTSCLPLLEKRPDATILITSSTAGIAINPFDPFYSLSKHAVTGFARALAPNLVSHGVRIACCCPAGADTQLAPPDVQERKKREGKPTPTAADIADSMLEVYQRAGNGDVWVAAGPGFTFKHDYATLPDFSVAVR